MKKVLLNAFRESVIGEMSRLLPQFSLVKVRERGEEQHLIKFAWVPKVPLTCGIAFRPLDDSFDAWVGWSTNGKFPYLCSQLSPAQGIWNFSIPAVMVPTIELSNRSGSAAWRLWEATDDQLANPSEFAEAFIEYTMKDQSADEARELVTPLVACAIAEIQEHGIPYLEKRLAALG